MTPSRARRVALITSNFWPERTGIGQVTTELARYLSSSGMEVRVATAMPYYPEWKIYRGYGGMHMRETLEDIDIRRSWHYVGKSPGSFGRIAHEVTLSLMSIRSIIGALRRSDIALIVSPDLGHAFVGSIAARLMGVRRVLIVQDVMPDAAIDLGMLRNPVVIRLAKWMARTMYRGAERVYTLGDGMRKRIERDVGERGKVGILSNTIDPGELDVGLNPGAAFRDRFVPAGTFAVVHAGNMGQKQDLDLLLRTAQRLRDEKDIHFYVFGDGAVKQDFLRRRDELKLANVTHFPFQDRQLLPHMLYGADALLVSQLPEVSDIVFPSKLVTAMGAGAMIVAACSPESETARIIRESSGGLTVTASDDAALANVILSIKRGAVDDRRYRDAARRWAITHFDREKVLGPFTRALWVDPAPSPVATVAAG